VITTTDFSFLELFALHLFPLIIGLIIVKLVKISLAKFIPIYFSLATVSILLKQFYYSSEYLWVSVITVVAGFVVLVIMSGFVGNKLSSVNYESILLSLGLFPWLLDWRMSVAFIVIFGFVIMVHSLIKQKKAFKKIEAQYMSLKEAKIKLSKEKYETFRKSAGVIYAVPMIIAALISTLMFSTSFI